MGQKTKCLNHLPKDEPGILEAAAREYFLNASEERLERVIEAGSRLVHYFIRLYGFTHSREDLYQAGVEGLLKALKRYRPDGGSSFTTYAGCLISGEIRHYVRKEASYYQPKLLAGLQRDVENVIQSRLEKDGDVPSLDEIADSLNIRSEAVEEVMRSGLVPLDEIDMSRIASRRMQSFRLPVEDRLLLEQAFYKLSDLQRSIIDMLFFKEMTQEQAAKLLGIQQRKVSRIKLQTLQIIREVYAAEGV